MIDSIKLMLSKMTEEQKSNTEVLCALFFIVGVTSVLTDRWGAIADCLEIKEAKEFIYNFLGEME